MPTKKGLKKKIIKKTTKKGKGNVSQSVVVNINKGKRTQPSSATLMKPTIASSLLSGLSSLAAALKLQQPSKSVSPVSETTIKKSDEEKISIPIPIPDSIKVNKPISQGRLKIDESIFNKFTESKPSIPAKMDIPSISALQPKPVSEYFTKGSGALQAPPVIEIPKKKDSKVKKLVIAIENKRMGQEDILAKNVEAMRTEATRQRQQAKIDYYNQQLPFSQSEEISYNPLSNATVGRSPLGEKMLYPEVEGVPLVEAEVRAKRQYVKSGKYSKKKGSVVESNIIPEEL